IYILKNEKGTFLPVQCDVTKDEDIYNLFDKIKETFGGVDVCVNNAGMVGCGLDLLNGTPEEWRQISNVKCDRPLSLLKTDGEFSKGKSIAAHQVLPLGSSHFYTGTKFAVRALSEGLRQELQAANSGIKLSLPFIGCLSNKEIYEKNMTMEKWKGRVALVTGASSGIGAAICEDLVKHGMKVVGAARRIEKMQPSSRSQRPWMFLDGTPEEWRQITNVNVIALCLCSKLTVNSLKERGLDDGHIINISRYLML
ncbi:Dehydrogenase/reductase SDR family member 11, partial [Armadillidium nasatum]